MVMVYLMAFIGGMSGGLFGAWVFIRAVRRHG